MTTGAGPMDTTGAECGCPSPTLGAETIQVEQVLGANMMQRVVEADMTVPDPKPDIEQIIDVFVKNLEITNIAVIADKVVVRGDLEIKVMYVAALPNQPVHAFEMPHVRWTRDIQVEGAAPGMKATADAITSYSQLIIKRGLTTGSLFLILCARGNSCQNSTNYSNQKSTTSFRSLRA